jgi:hypothetical protein
MLRLTGKIAYPNPAAVVIIKNKHGKVKATLAILECHSCIKFCD